MLEPNAKVYFYSMHYIDTHTHLYSESFDQDRDDTINRAIEAGIDSFILPAIDASYYDAMVTLQKAYPDRMHLMAGLHPTHVKEKDYKHELQIVKENLDSRKFCAVGEIGVDLYWDKSTCKIQKEAFATQINWAHQHDLPIVIHCRDAFDEVFEVLEAEKNSKLRGVFHCFTGTLEDAHRALEYNLKLGIGGVVTFKNGKIDKFLKDIDLKHIVLETDAPYLAPSPFRGKRNESSYLTYVAERVAHIYEQPLQEIAKITSANAKSIFNLN